MICPKCGANNIDGSSFCIKCGTNLKEMPQMTQQPINNVPTQNVQPQNNQVTQMAAQPVMNQVQTNYDQPVINNQQPVINTQPQTNYQQPVINQNNANVNNSPLNYLTYIINVLLKPFKTFKEEETKLCNPKTSLIFSAIVAVAMMLITLFKAMISSIFVKTIDRSTYEYKTTVDFSQLKNLDWVGLLVKNLLIFAGVIVAIALIYYIVSLMFKKSTNFIKMLSVSATSLIPYIALGMIVSPILGKIWTPLSIIATVIGAVYSLLIFINLMNEDLVFDNVDLKIYFHLICLSVLGSAGYYLYMKFMVSSVSKDLNDLLNIFG